MSKQIFYSAFHGDKERAATVYQGIDALQAQDIADTVVYVTSQPRRVQITDMTIMANQQATGSWFIKTKNFLEKLQISVTFFDFLRIDK